MRNDGSPVAAREVAPAGGSENLQTVARAAQLLLAFRFSETWSVSASSRHLNISKSMAHRLLNTLADHGFVVFDPAARAYRLGTSIVELGRAAVEGPAIVDIARPFVEEGAQRTAETVSFCTIRGMRGVCLDYADSPHAMRMTVQRGQEFTLNAGAIGKCLLAFQDEAFLEAVEKSGGIHAYTENTLSDPVALRAELRSIREQGVAFSTGEITPGASSVGVPLFEEDGSVRYCLAASGPALRFDAESMQSTAAILQDIAERLSVAIRPRANSIRGRVDAVE